MMLHLFLIKFYINDINSYIIMYDKYISIINNYTNLIIIDIPILYGNINNDNDITTVELIIGLIPLLPYVVMIIIKLFVYLEKLIMKI